MNIEQEKFNYKTLNKKEIDVAIKRFLRFRYPPDKKNRIYKQILTRNSISPKISLKSFDSLKKADIDSFVSLVWDKSLKELDESSCFNPFGVDDVRCFNSRLMLEDLLNASFPERISVEYVNNILLENGYKKLENAITYDDFYIGLNSQFPIRIPYSFFSYRINRVVLVEGATEEILLPCFAKMLGFDFEEYGVFLVASGGKNQVAKSYLEYKYILNLPVFVVMDADAKEQADDIKKVLRKKDKIHLIKEGEFEDIISKELILKALNFEFKNISKIKSSDLEKGLPMSKILHELYKEKGFGEFKKVEFANLIKNHIFSASDVSLELVDLIYSFL